MKNLKHFFNHNWTVVLFVVISVLFFWQFFFRGKIPIPGDTIVGMYNPWRDEVWDRKISGVPVKNFLITDPVRQQYIWRKLAINQMKAGNLPLWNPYSFSGTPLLANVQSAPFYPLNILFVFLPFPFAWGVLVVLQIILANVFTYFFLRHIQVGKVASLIGSLSFVFSGFTIAWLEWNTLIHVALWLPLLLLSVEKLSKKITPTWIFLYLFASISQIFAGHLQILFYSQIVLHLYLLAKVISLLKARNSSKIFIGEYLLTILLMDIVALAVTAIAWIPAIQLIVHSAREFDQGSFLKDGWFIPWQNLIQFLIPDFFGHPSTLNYWGVWNYAEFVGYIGVGSFIFSLYSLFFVRSKKVLFFGTLIVVSLLLSLPTPLSSLPYIWSVPFISSSQPTRLLFIVDFSLSILAAFGVEEFLKAKNRKNMMVILLLVGLVFFSAFSFLFFFSSDNSTLSSLHVNISMRNILPPLFFFSVISFILLFPKTKRVAGYATGVLILFIIIDLFRFGWKFTPFTPWQWLYPETRITKLIPKDIEKGRILATDSKIMPPNFSGALQLFDISGYDPLYILEYGQLIASWERNAPDISPSAFNRILTPQNPHHFIANLLGVRYILSLKESNDIDDHLIAQKGETYLYENNKAFPRVFLVHSLVRAKDSQDAIEKLYQNKENLREVGIVERDVKLESDPSYVDIGPHLEIYEAGRIRIQLATGGGFLILTDVYYPTWKVYIDNKESELYRVDFALRGVVVPKGVHTVEFRDHLL